MTITSEFKRVAGTRGGRISLAIACLVTLALLWWLGARAWLLHELESRFPVVSVEQRLREAVTAGSRSLSAIDTASVLVSAPVGKIVPTAKPGFGDAIDLGGGMTVKLSNFQVVGKSQQIEIESDFVVVKDTLRVGGHLSAAAIPSVLKRSDQGLDMVVAPLIRSWRFDSVHFGQIPWNLGALANILSAPLTASAKQISERLGAVVTPIQLSSQPKKISIPQTDKSTKEVSLPGYTVSEMAVLVDDDAIFALLKLTSNDKQSHPAGSGADFARYKTQFAQLVQRDYGHGLVNQGDPAIELSRSFLHDFVVAETASATTIPQRVQQSIESNAAQLQNRGALVSGVYISRPLLERTARTLLATAAKGVEERHLGKISEIDVKLQQQAIRVAGRLEHLGITRDITVSGAATGVVVPTVTPGAVNVYVAFESIDFDNLTLAGWQLDPLKILLLLQHTRETVLPVVNGLIPPLNIELKPLKGGAAKLLPKTGTTSVSFRPSELPLPAVLLGSPSILIDDSGLRALVAIAGIGSSPVATASEGAPAQTQAGAASIFTDPMQGAIAAFGRTLRSLAFFEVNRPTSDNPAPTNPVQPSQNSKQTIRFEDYKKQFDDQWAASIDPNDTSADAFAFIRKAVLSSYLNAAWPPGGVQADIAFNETSALKDTHHRVGHIDTDFDCKRTRQCTRGACTRGACNRNACTRGGCGRSPGECGYSCEVCWRVGPYKDCKDNPTCVAGRIACNAAAEARVVSCNAQEESAVAACNVREESNVAACNTREEANVAACNIREEAALLDCNRLAEMEVAACNIKREAAKGLSNLGEIGSTSGDMSYSGRGVLTLSAVRADDAMSTISVGANLSAGGLVAADVKFVPYGGMGHVLGCYAPITFKPVMRASVDSAIRLNASSSLAPKDVSGQKKLVWTITVPEIMATGKLNPAPADALFISNPEMTLVCPFLSGAAELSSLLGKGLTVLTGEDIAKTVEDDPDPVKTLKDARNFLVQFGGGMAYLKSDPQTIEVDVPAFDLEIAGATRSLQPKGGKRALVYELLEAAARN